MTDQNRNEKSNDAKTNKSHAKTRPVTAIVLAAGKGTRMATSLPKVLHPCGGKPMISLVYDACKKAGIEEVRVVVGHAYQLVKSVVEPMGAVCCLQAHQLGTADAVKSAQVDSLEGDVLILNGDHPLLTSQDLVNVINEFRSRKLDLAVVTADLKVPGDFGRIVRHMNKLKAIVEAKDASAETLKIREINTGIYMVNSDVLKDYLPKIKNNNSKQEYYLTDLISLAIDDQLAVDAIKGNGRMAFGVNNQVELAKASAHLFRQKAKSLMEAGVMILNPKVTYIEADVKIGSGSVIYPNVFLKGQTEIGQFSVVEPNCMLIDSKVGNSVQVKMGSHLEQSVLMDRSHVGPYARLRPGSEIGEEAHLGNFVETKKVKFGKRSKAGHLTYLGDAEIGEDVNIGCGTITCNYAIDKKKYKTVIGDRVFVGSDTQFIAPIKIGSDVVIGSGSTITKDVPDRALAVARGKQFVKENYVSVVETSETHENQNIKSE